MRGAARRAARARLGLLLGVAALVFGCATGAKPQGMAPGGRPEPRELDAARLARVPTLTLRTTGGRATNPLHTSQIANAAFTEALAWEIARAGLFRPVYDAPADYHLHVHLEQVERPFWGWLDMEVRILARWRLYETETGRLVWEELVPSTFTASGADSSLGIRRLRLANEGSARANIARGVAALAQLSPGRPGA